MIACGVWNPYVSTRSLHITARDINCRSQAEKINVKHLNRRIRLRGFNGPNLFDV